MTSSGSSIVARGTKQIPSTKYSRISTAIWRLRRDLPTPPVPRSVIKRMLEDVSRAQTFFISCSRPISGVRVGGIFQKGLEILPRITCADDMTRSFPVCWLIKFATAFLKRIYVLTHIADALMHKVTSPTTLKVH